LFWFYQWTKRNNRIIIDWFLKKPYKARPIRSTSSIVSGNDLLSVSGQIVTNATAMIEVVPNTIIGK
jgi:enamine deaminase RidA (YjgF/YER057c/UK114 family)